MATMNISLPDALRVYVERQVAERGYGTTSEYVRDLIRRDQQRDALRSALLDGAASPQLTEATRAWFELETLRRLRAAGPEGGLASVAGGWEDSDDLVRILETSSRVGSRGGPSLD